MASQRNLAGRAQALLQDQRPRPAAHSPQRPALAPDRFAPDGLTRLQAAIGNRATARFVAETLQRDAGRGQPERANDGGQPKQAMIQRAALVKDRLNVAGERHDESAARRDEERAFARAQTGSRNYWQENEFTAAAGGSEPADPHDLRIGHRLLLAKQQFDECFPITRAEHLGYFEYGELDGVSLIERSLSTLAIDDLEAHARLHESAGPGLVSEFVARFRRLNDALDGDCRALRREVGLVRASFASGASEHIEQVEAFGAQIKDSAAIASSLDDLLQHLGELRRLFGEADAYYHFAQRDFSHERSEQMHRVAEKRAGENGVWKVGAKHAEDMQAMDSRRYNLLTRGDFNAALEAWRKPTLTRIWEWVAGPSEG